MNEQITKLLEQLAAKLGTTAEHLWGVLIRQARIEAVTDSLFVILTLVGGYWYYRWIKSYIKRNPYEDAEIAGLIILGIPMVVSTIISFICLFLIPSELFNPEYWALKEVLNALK